MDEKELFVTIELEEYDRLKRCDFAVAMLIHHVFETAHELNYDKTRPRYDSEELDTILALLFTEERAKKLAALKKEKGVEA